MAAGTSASSDEEMSIATPTGFVMIAVCFCIGLTIPMAVFHWQDRAAHRHLKTSPSHSVIVERVGSGDVSNSTADLGADDTRPVPTSTPPAPLLAPTISPPQIRTPTPPTATTRASLHNVTTLASMDRLAQFRQECQALYASESSVVGPTWAPSAELNSKFGTRGEHVTCIQRRNIFRDVSESAAGVRAEWAVSRAVMTLGRVEALIAGNPTAPVLWRTTTGVVTTTLISMFHVVNDFVLPWSQSWSSIVASWEEGGASGSSSSPSSARRRHILDPFREIPLDYIMVIPQGTLRGKGSDGIAIMSMETFVEKSSGRDLYLRLDEENDKDPSIRCYCRGVLQPPSGLVSYGPTAYIGEGDQQRIQWTLRFKMKLNERFGFAPYGTYPVPQSEYAEHGLWRNASLPESTPRLLLLLRRSSRKIGNGEGVEELARQVGFNVQVFTPEMESLERQARAARYADVMVAMHGQALTWMALMDGTTARHCREIIELQHFGRPFRRVHNVYELLAADSVLRYRRIPAVHVTFDNTTINPAMERKQLLKKSFPHLLQGFMTQTAYHDPNHVRAAFSQTWARQSACIRANAPAPWTLDDIRATGGERVFKF